MTPEEIRGLVGRLLTQSTEIGDRAEVEELMREAADALAALTTPQEGYAVEIGDQRFTLEQWEAVQRYCGGHGVALDVLTEAAEAVLLHGADRKTLLEPLGRLGARSNPYRAAEIREGAKT